MTQTETISARYNSDRYRTVDVDGISIDEACSAAPGSRVYSQTRRDTSRWGFRDGPCITICGGALDLGYPGCYCWRGAGHVDGCVGGES